MNGLTASNKRNPGKEGTITAADVLLRCERYADQFLVVPRKHALVRKCGMAPDDRSIELCGQRRLKDLRAANLVVARRAETGEYQVAGFREDHVAVAVLDQERCPRSDPRPRRFLLADYRLVRFPEALAGFEL